MSKKKKIAAALMGVLLTLSSVIGASAASYTDIQRHWAKDYIEKITSNKLISGYEDGKFKPDTDVSRLEAIIMTCNLFNADIIDNSYKANLSKWQDKLKQNNIPDWSWKYVVFALENKIIPSSDAMLSSLISKTNKNEQIKALKYEAVVFLVNALGWADERSTAVALKYKDTSEINPQARPYIDVLIKKGIIGEKGDNYGNFGAKKGVTRAEMAVMLANSYRYSQRATGASNTAVAGTTPEITQPPVTPAVTPTTGAVVSKANEFIVVDGTVVLTSQTGNDASIFIMDSNGKTDVYSNKVSDIQVKIVNNPANLTDIKNGDKVRLLTTADKKVNTVILGENRVVSGVFSAINTTVNIQIRTTGDRMVEYVVDSNARVSLDGYSAKLTDIRVNDNVDLTLSNGKVTEIKATSARGTTIGYNNPQSGSYRFRNAVIKEMRLTTTGNRIVVEDADGKIYDLAITYRTAIRFKNAKDDISSLQVGYLVDIYGTGNEIDEISTYGDYKASKIDGVVLNIDDRNRFIEIQVNQRDIIKVYYDSNTSIEDVRGSYINVSRIYRGDKVTVTGYQGSGGIDASRIIVDIQY